MQRHATSFATCHRSPAYLFQLMQRFRWSQSRQQAPSFSLFGRDRDETTVVVVGGEGGGEGLIEHNIIDAAPGMLHVS